MTRIISILILSTFLFTSCQKLKDPGATAAVSIANEWWVTLDSVGIPDLLGYGHFKLATYNTAANDNTIWVDDLQNATGVKFRAQADFGSLTFAAQNSVNAYYDTLANFNTATVTVTEGKIFPNMGHSRAGNIVDSIHMKVEFSDDPGSIYEYNGTARTKLIEDEW